MRQNHTGPNKSPKPSKRELSKPGALPPAVVRPRAPGADLEAKALDHAALGIPARLHSTKDRARYDRPGHIADAHAERLLHLSQRRSGRDEFTLVFDSAAGDDLATELAEQAVTSMVGGGETWLDTVNAQVEEEEGGPFLETRADREFASGPEAEDGTQGFLREALPTPSAGNSVHFEGVRRGRRP
jgi:hypothetical protein